MLNIYKFPLWIHLWMFLYQTNDETFVSYNQPKFCTQPSWNELSITFVKRIQSDARRTGLFIDHNNTVYIQIIRAKRIQKLSKKDLNSLILIPVDDDDIMRSTLFVSTIGDIYVANTGQNGRVHKWRSTDFERQLVTFFCLQCLSIFIDIRNTLYCSMREYHQIVSKSLDDNSNTLLVVAGVGYAASTTVALKHPHGTFVTIDFDLYVADTENHRIQLFRRGELTGVTVAGTLQTIELNYPTAIVLDVDNYLYIVDSKNHRVVGSNPSGFRCLIGCSEIFHQESHHLDNPINMAFDANGHMYITSDSSSDRVRKFILSTPLSNELSFFQSIYSSKLTAKSQSYKRTDDMIAANYYYESIQIQTFSDDTYSFSINSSINMYGYLYGRIFNPIGPSENLIFKHYGHCDINSFKVRSHLRSNTTYILVMTPYQSQTIGIFSVIVTGRNQVNFSTVTVSIDQTVYSSNLTFLSHQYNRFICGSSNHYYEAIELIFNTTGTARVSGTSDIHICGYLYREHFDPFPASKDSIISMECNTRSYNIEIEDVFQANIPYILIVTTYDGNKIEEFHIVASSLTRAFINRMNILNTLPIVESNYTLAFTNNSEIIGRVECSSTHSYYVATLITVNVTGLFRIEINSTIEIYMYLYETYFDPLNRHLNLLLWKDEKCIPTILVSSYASGTRENQTYSPYICEASIYPYDILQLNVNTTGFYKLSISGSPNILGSLYEKSFHPFRVNENLKTKSGLDCGALSLKIDTSLVAKATYILVLSSRTFHRMIRFVIDAYGLGTITYNRMIMVKSTYISALIKDFPTYSRVCRTGSYHYETVEVNVEQNGVYGFRSNSTIILYGYIYENKFDPFHPNVNLIMSSNHTCSLYEFEIVVHLQMNIKYILVVTTSLPYTEGPFSIFVIGPSNVSLNRIISKYDDCRIGDQCRSYTRAIGLTLDDIFYNKTRPDKSLNKQSLFVKISAAITMIMFVGGLINSILSILTFQNKELQKVGCGMYLLASSITSLVTISLFTAKFCFFILLEMNVHINLFLIRATCVSIEFLLKASLYLDAWLNACVAIERTIAVFKQVNFDKKKSRYAAKWIIICLPFLITSTVIHDPLHRRLFEYQTQTYKIKNTNDTAEQTIEYDLRSNQLAQAQVNQVKNDSPEYDRKKDQFVLDQTHHHLLCVVEYSSSVQKYSIAILFIHLLIPFIANLFSALYIIFGTARQRSITQRKKSFKTHAIEQIQEHKQLLISPLVLLILSLPRLIIALIPGCVNPSNNEWLYPFGYFISFVPSMLIFVIFVLPSKLYKKTLKETLQRCQPRRSQH